MISFLVMLVEVAMNPLLWLLHGRSLLVLVVIWNSWPVLLKRNKGGRDLTLAGSRLT